MWLFGGLITFTGLLVWLARSRLRASWRGQSGRSGGVAYRWRRISNALRIGTQGAEIEIAIDCPSPFWFEARSERGVDRLFKWLGLSVEIQLGEPKFDRAVYLMADDERFAEWLRSQPTASQSLLSLVEAGAVLIRCEVGRLAARFVIGERGDDQTLAFAISKLPAMNVVAKLLQAEPRGALARLREDRFWKATLILSASTALGITGLLELLRTRTFADSTVGTVLDVTRLLSTGLGSALVLWGGLLALAVSLLGRTSRFHVVLRELLLIGLPGALICGAYWAFDYNAEFDPGSVQLIEATVDSTWTKRRPQWRSLRRAWLRRHISVDRDARDQRRYTYHFSVRAQDADLLDGRKRFHATPSVYRRLGPGQVVRFEVRTGALGARWVSGIEPVSATLPAH